MSKPIWWFKEIDECEELDSQPYAIEYLNISTGETFIHIGGTAFWRHGRLHTIDLRDAGISHWRLRPDIHPEQWINKKGIT